MKTSNNIHFFKYQGTGNDFIMIDAINERIPKLTKTFIKKVCHRRFGVGADGLIILRPPTSDNDFIMEFYNSDGSLGSMCGNGGRCVVAFAHNLKIIKKHTTFLAPDGEHSAVFQANKNIALKMQDVKKIEYHQLGLFIDTGSPHLLIFSEHISQKEAYEEGKKIRYSSFYKKKGGVNVNFITYDKQKINLITYERGVEDITYSCGTGSVAAALAMSIKNQLSSPVKIITQGGMLKVKFNNVNNKEFKDIWLIGEAKEIFEGNIYL